MTDYKPRPVDLLWTQSMINMLADGGSWALPMTGGVYQIDKTAKTLTLIAAHQWGPEDMHERIRANFGALGYTVHPGPDAKEEQA